MAALSAICAIVLAGVRPHALSSRIAVARVRSAPVLRVDPSDGEPAPAPRILDDVRNMTAALDPLVTAIAAYRTEGPGWDAEQSAAKRAEIIELYQQLFVPAAGFALANLFVYLSVIGLTLVGLEVSGVGFVQAREWLLGVTDSAPWIAGTVGRLNPALGNFAIAFVVAELAGPLVIGASVALSSRTTDSLRGFLAARGLDARGASEKLEELLANSKQSQGGGR